MDLKLKIGEFTFNKLQLIGIVVLLVGLIVGIFLVQQTQIFKPRASTTGPDLTKAFKVTNERGETLNCVRETRNADGSIKDPVTCTTDTLNVNIQVQDLAELTK